MGTKRLLVYRASAGSGKTHQLVTTYLRLVLAGKQGEAITDIDREDTETVAKRSKILRKAAKGKGK